MLRASATHSGETTHVPTLIHLEVAQVLRRYVARGEVTPARATLALDLLIGFPVERYTHEPLLTRIWELRKNLTAYDAAYVALAEGLRAPLVTCDARLANAPGIRASVELFGQPCRSIRMSARTRRPGHGAIIHRETIIK